MLLLSSFAAGLATAAPAGLEVREGVLLKDGRPYQAIGANYFSLFSRLLKNPADESSLTNLARLARAEVPFVRFMCGGFWPVEHQMYLTNRTEYFVRLDRVVRCAESNRVGLIPSLFWNVATVSDLVGEPIDQLGNADSKTIAFIRRYTEEVVRRYQNSPALWAWEFGNEYNLGMDLPNAREHRPPVVPQLGTPGKRTERDELTFEHMRTAFVAFGNTIRKIDDTRTIISGNALPRSSAWHNSREHSWKADSVAQFSEILRRDNPDPMNLLSIHVYGEKSGGYPGGAKSIEAIVGLASQVAQKSGKPLFIGEFGVPRQWGDRAGQESAFGEFLVAIEKHRVPLAAFWVFDFGSQDKDWNVSFENDRSWMLDQVSELNRRLTGSRRRRRSVARRARSGEVVVSAGCGRGGSSCRRRWIPERFRCRWSG
jgi:hypothetical protein